MHFSNIFPNDNPLNTDLKTFNKEQFFSVKRKHRRLKNSTFIFQQTTIQQKLQEQKSLKTTLPTSTAQIYKELQSTFGSGHALQFRSKPPKRKTNIKTKIMNGQKVESESLSEDELVSPNFERNTVKKQNQIKLSLNKTKNWNIEDFICLAKIGQGSYSEVFKVFQKKSGFICSLKAIKKQKIKQLKFEQNLFRQIKISLFLDHPHIIKLYGFFDDEYYVYLLFELATDQNLYDLLSYHKARSLQPIHISQTQTYIAHLCLALNFMHNNNILHRDIKPQNILITFSNTIKVCDFGWSIYNPDKILRATLCGTPLYLAPQLVKKSQYNQLVDVWATGVLAYQLLTSQIPFKIKSLKDLKKVVTQEIKYDKIVDLQARQFISSALQKDKEDRKSIRELLNSQFIYKHLKNDHF